MKKIVVSLLVMMICQTLYAKSFEMLRLQQRLNAMSQNLANGFDKVIKGEDWGYDNLWNNKTSAMISRATNGTMVMEWTTDPTKIIVNGYANFLLLAGVDQTNTPVEFDMAINGVKVGAIRNLAGQSWSQTTSAGVRVVFEGYSQNAWGDGMGFITMSVPQSMVEIGKPLHVTLVGRKANVNTWIMIFKNKSLLEEISLKCNKDRLYRILVDDSCIKITTLADHKSKFIGRWSNDRSAVPKLRFGADSLVLSFEKIAGKGFKLLRDGHLVFSVDNVDEIKSKNTLHETTLTRIIKLSDKPYFWVTQEYSDAVDRMHQLDSSFYRSADVHIMVSSHQDIAWVDSPYQCVEDRDKRIVTPALELMQQHADYRYDIEDALILEEYVERHPDKLWLLSKLIKSGQLGIGASYTQPYEEIQSDEALVRQFYFGKRWVDKLFGGTGQRTYWNMDVPSRTPQMPQILKKCGVDYLMYSRHKAGLYRWIAQDDCSSVLAFTPGHYTAAAQFLRNAPELEIERMTHYMKQYPDYRKDAATAPVIGLLSAEDMSEARTYYNWISSMAKFSEQYAVAMPKIQHSTADRFMDAFVASNDKLPQLKGERPDLWQYIHSASHADAFYSYRQATRMSMQAETFSTVAALLSGNFDRYPTRELNDMWRAIIYPDHGWGGNKGSITDSLFTAKYLFAKIEADKLLDRALCEITAYMKIDLSKGEPIIVFNGASWNRSDYCEVNIPQSLVDAGAVLRSVDGQIFDYQIISCDAKSGNAKIGFVAEDVPSIGYLMLYMTTNKKSKRNSPTVTAYETLYYRLDMVDGELRGIFDKELGRQLFDVSKFGIADVICMQSVGNGAGEFASMQLPTMDHYEQASQINNHWTMLSDGAVFSLFTTTAKFRNAEIVRYMKVYKQTKRIDFSTDVNSFDGAHYLEYRQVFPMKEALEVTYQVPFGAVTVGRDEIQGAPGERYQDEANLLHPRTSSGWIAASKNKMTLALTSSAALVDYIDPTDLQNSKTILQAVLFASRKSCHWLGEFYTQRGDHHFEFSITSQTGKWRDCAKNAMSFDRPMVACYNPPRYTDAFLPTKASFFEVEGGNTIITAIKKAEDDNDVIVRLYDVSGVTSSITLRSLFNIKQISQTNMLENNATPIDPIVQPLGRNSIATYKITVSDEK